MTDNNGDVVNNINVVNVDPSSAPDRTIKLENASNSSQHMVDINNNYNGDAGLNPSNVASNSRNVNNENNINNINQINYSNLSGLYHPHANQNNVHANPFNSNSGSVNHINNVATDAMNDSINIGSDKSGFQSTEDSSKQSKQKNKNKCDKNKNKKKNKNKHKNKHDGKEKEKEKEKTKEKERKVIYK